MEKKNKKIVFFGCSMRGGQFLVGRNDLLELIRVIESNGCSLISKHQTTKGAIEEDGQMEKSFIHDRDYEWLKESDFGIFEISNPSLGVGGEISDLINIGKPVLCLYKKGLEEGISAYILGKEKSKYLNSLFESHSYASFQEADGIVKNFLKKIN